ncbi:MAG: nucleotidyltransferase domain-containing protein [Bacillota bacterium]
MNLPGGQETRYYTHVLQNKGRGSGSPGTVSNNAESSHGNAYTSSVESIIPQSSQNIKSDSAPVNPILQALEAKKAEQQAKRDAFSRTVERSLAEKRLARTDNKAVAPSEITDYNKNNYGGQTSGTESGVSEGAGKLPQGLDKQSFETASKLIRDTAGSVSDDIVVQGSRAAGTATADSDIDFAIRVSQEQFDNLIKQYFKTPNPGSAAERTLRHAIQSGKIQSGEAKLSGLRKMLEKQFGMKVDISIILKGGPFDNGTTIRLP